MNSMRPAMRTPRYALAMLFLMMAGLSAACSPVGVVAGAGATAAVAASEERGVSGTVSDTGIRLAINDAWFNADFDMYRRVGLQVYEGRVLLTGIVPTDVMRDQAVQLAWQPEDVRTVINEIIVGGGRSIDDTAIDTYVTSEVKARLLLDRNVDAINYSTRTVDGTVYLLGIAQDQTELDRVFEVVSNIRNVDRVVSHVLLRDDPRRSL